MTWSEAFRKGQDRFVIWIAAGAVLACGFLIKKASPSEFLWAVVIGAVNGAAVGFGVGPAAEKGSMMLSGILAGTPFYFIGGSIIVMLLFAEQNLHLSDVIWLVLVFVMIGMMISIAQVFQLRRGRRIGG